jgi:hypothetical protein
MMPRRIATLIVSLAFAAGADAFAQVKAGLNEINGSATVQGTKVDGSDTFTAATFIGTYGRFLTDSFEVGPQLSVLKAEGVDASGTIDGFAAFHFVPASAVVPYSTQPPTRTTLACPSASRSSSADCWHSLRQCPNGGHTQARTEATRECFDSSETGRICVYHYHIT